MSRWPSWIAALTLAGAGCLSIVLFQRWLHQALMFPVPQAVKEELQHSPNFAPERRASVESLLALAQELGQLIAILAYLPQQSPSLAEDIPGEVILGIIEVHGSIDKKVIQRIILRHINEMKLCYERELSLKPDLQGRVILQFIIGPMDAVAASYVKSSSMANQSVEQCLANALRRWEFPRTLGGRVTATCPLEFRPSRSL